MGNPSWDDIVLIEHGKNPGDPSVITINCPDKAGLGCDLLRIILEFGLYVSRGDFSTDGKWCYIVLWVVPRPSSLNIDWESAKNRLLAVCPSCRIGFYFNQQSSGSSPSPVYLLKVFCLDRKGLLHDVTKVLCELELIIQRVKVMTTPEGKVLDLFFITDSLDLLHTKERQLRTCENLEVALGEYCISCELDSAGPVDKSPSDAASVLPAIADELFSCELSNKERNSEVVSSDVKEINKPTVMVDNLMSPSHTLLQIQCVDQKGLIYDILRTIKDFEIQIAHGRIHPSAKGYRNVDLFVNTADGKKILCHENQITLCSRLKEEMLHPLRVTITSRGPDTELLIANPVELSGKGRPRVFYDITSALKTLGIRIFSAQIDRRAMLDRQWELYRFLLDESREFPLSSKRARSEIVDRVKRTLMGWCSDNAIPQPQRRRTMI